jgi:hypothetical protein
MFVYLFHKSEVYMCTVKKQRFVLDIGVLVWMVTEHGEHT